MKISWRWLSQILDLSYIDPVSLARTLTMAGFEVEDIKEIEISKIKDTILDVVSIPNRGDLGSATGIAREVAVLLQQKLNFNFHNLFFSYCRNSPCQMNLNRDLNYIYCVMILVKNLEIQKSPQFIQNRLKFVNVQPVNNIIDIINYIKLQWGQEIQLFNISGLDIIDPKSILTIESYTKLNNICCKQAHASSVDIDRIKISNIGKSELPMSTVLIEMSIPIINQSGCINILGNKLRKKWQNIDENVLCHAAQEFIFLYKKFCNASIQDYQTLIVRESFQKCVKIMKKNLMRILGPTTKHGQVLSVNELQVTRILNWLNLNPVFCSSFWLVTIPQYRYHDLEREIDVIAEIARTYGLNCFYDVLPDVRVKNKLLQRELLQRQIRSFLRNIGLHELVHSSIQKIHNINLINPLSDEYSGLRHNLTVRLIQSCYYNVYQKNSELDGFELGKIFYVNPVSNIMCERLHLGVIWSGKSYLSSNWSCKPNSMNWLQAKGMLSNLCQCIGVNLTWKKAHSNFYLKQVFYPQRTANLYSSGKNIGLFGEVNPELSYNLGIRDRLYAFEIDLDTILYQMSNSYALGYQLKPYSKYPHVVRDISMVISKNVSIDSILSIISSINNSFIQSIELFDEYLGDQIPLNCRSISLRLKYQSFHETLTTVQITQLDNIVKHMMKNELNVEIRL
uniref:phenylalanine--tRNA ligase n=1 Tax=Hildenbrandia rivularis TaxID=135206 RepID=A0A1C9CFP0_9FLOR|nr:phenylalanyl-tRNA synthetase beta chain [Hildenbrandia rivularis]AOM67203.1 phenylalanyl-tRNA synthetase beta chain [Hildenbrandia rivularis]